MRNADHERIEAVLHEALRLRPARRAAFLDTSCARDPDLRREVESLLAQVDRADSVFNSSTVDQYLHSAVRETHSDNTDDDVWIGAVIGPYRLVECIGSGGMGNVYRAIRHDGSFDQTVAIKLIRGGLDTTEVRDRFRRERQVLANLNHPNIARLIDGGVTEHDQPYLVMEFIRGTSLLSYCNAHRVTIEERLRHFDTICSAVQHAHANLVVHRDLKPANILIDEDGRPQLLDFGIASLLNDDGGEGTLTGSVDRRLTPQYAAPEQVRGDAVTVATDIYALGLILYELLVDCRPYEVASARSPGLDRLICETAMLPPSQRLDALARTGEVDPDAIAQARNIDPSRLRRRIRGDLDHIVLSAMRKEPERRYSSVEALREDLRRFRERLPISARPDSWTYRAGRFVRRHRIPVMAVAAALIVLIAASVVSTSLAVQLNQRSHLLYAAIDERQLALDDANAQRAAVERAFRRTRASQSMLISLVAAVAADDDVARHCIIDQIVFQRDRVDAMALPVSAESEIAARQSLAMLARAVGAFDLALEQNRRVLALTENRPEEAPARAEAFAQTGWLHLQRGEPIEAVRALRETQSYDYLNPDPGELTWSDLLLVEALLASRDVKGAADVLQSRRFPPSPVDTRLREAIRILEVRYNVTLPVAPGH